VLARKVEKIEGSFKAEEFAPPEGMWVLRVKDFPAVVTMDSHGRSLHDDVEAASQRRLRSLLRGT
jgi:fumarate hydratase class I